MLTLLTAAFVLNAYGIVTGRFDYPFPGEIIGLCQLVLGAAISVLTLGGIAAMRAHEDDDDTEVLAIEPAEEVAVTIEPEPQAEHLNNLYPVPWEGDLAIMEVNDDGQE